VSQPEPPSVAPDGPEQPERGPAEPDPELGALKAPPRPAFDPAPLILAGRQALTPALLGPAQPPRLHPDQWGALCALPKPAAPAAEAKAEALPPLNFILSSGTSQEAWMGGVGYRRGAVVRDGFILTRITATGIVLSGPSGPVPIPLKADSAPAASPKGKAVQP
jgi:hypothetical protein